MGPAPLKDAHARAPAGIDLEGRPPRGARWVPGWTPSLGRAMRETQFFPFSLGIGSPWYIAASGFDAERHWLASGIDLKPDARFIPGRQGGRLNGARHDKDGLTAPRLLPVSGMPACEYAAYQLREARRAARNGYPRRLLSVRMRRSNHRRRDPRIPSSSVAGVGCQAALMARLIRQKG